MKKEHLEIFQETLKLLEDAGDELPWMLSGGYDQVNNLVDKIEEIMKGDEI